MAKRRNVLALVLGMVMAFASVGASAIYDGAGGLRPAPVVVGGVA